MNKITTDASTYDAFRPHGRIEYQAEGGNIMRATGTGPFNEEMVDVIRTIEMKALESFVDFSKPWYELVVFQESCVAIDDALLFFTKHLRDLKA